MRPKTNNSPEPGGCELLCLGLTVRGLWECDPAQVGALGQGEL